MSSARRRMIVQKYHNRPPFDLKKKEALTKNFRKSFQHVEQSFRTIMDHLNAIQSEYDIDIIINPDEKENVKIIPQQPKINNVVPKIIESFRKATPKRIHVCKNSKRFQGYGKKLAPNKLNVKEDVPVETLYKNENLTFGKNIPDHKIMKNLLEDFNTLNVNARIDKSTSTTGIIWPVPCTPPLPSTKNKVRHQKIKSKISTKRNKGKSIKADQVTDLKCNSKYCSSFVGSKSFVCPKSEGTFIVDQRLRNEKSFVKMQVENYNKKSNRNRTGMIKTKNNCKNYLGMMNSVKNKLPKFDPRTEVSISENCGWSSTTENEPKRPEDISFPRETKDAVELLIKDSRRFLKTPLAKYLKHQDTLSIQPAISMNHMSGFQRKSPKKVESNPEPTAYQTNSYQAAKDGSCRNSKKSWTQKPKASR